LRNLKIKISGLNCKKYFLAVIFMEVKIYKNTSSEGIRNAISGFGRFSSIEIEEKNDATQGKFLIF
jgi:hypothetical protein